MRVETLVVGPIETNCYLVWDEESGKGVVIDPGASSARILQALRQHDISVEAILLTHGHFDHTHAVPHLLQEMPLATVYLHTQEVGEDKHLQYTPPANWKAYDEGDVVEVGALRFEVMHTPGHSLGSVTLRCRDYLFTGDTLFQNNCGRADLYGGNEVTLMQSLRRIGQIPGDLKVCPGHMGQSTLDAERRSNPYLQQALRG